MNTLIINTKMAVQPPQDNNFVIFLQFVKDSWPMILSMFSAYQVIKRVSDWVNKRQDIRLQQLIDKSVNPQIESLTNAIDKLREEFGSFKAKL